MLSCSNQNEFIPNVYVNEIIDLSIPAYSDLNTPGNSMFIEGGVEGIIIYRETINSFKVYDRNCSYEPSSTCAQIDSIASGIAYCECCSSAFLISNSGEAINSPAILSLKKYNWSFNNNMLRIFN